MKIDDIYRGLNLVQDAGEPGIAKKTELPKIDSLKQPDNNNKDAKVEISAASVMFNKVRAAIEAEDPERVAKVQAIKEKIEKGLYEVNPQKIADKILQERLSKFFED